MNTAPLRVGNCSGFYGDQLSAMRDMLDGGDIDVITGDYLAELTMLILGRDRLKDESLGYAKTFVKQIEQCLFDALERGVKIVSNAGGLNPAGLAQAIEQLAAKLGVAPKIAYVYGDDLHDQRAELGVPDAITANAYLGGFGIARALKAGADIVVTGRVTDASLVVGPAAWHHGWSAEDFDAIAGAMAAGHVIECGTQATGGNFAWFTRVPPQQMLRPGFPIAEVAQNGSSVITKHPGTGGLVSPATVTAQLLYEVQGTRYFGPDATLRLDSIQVSDAGPDRVQISGVRGEKPPASLKVSTTTLGGFRNEMTFQLTGLDIEAKASLVEAQMRDRLNPPPAEIEFRLARTDHPDADTQAAATAMLNVVAWDTDPARVGRAFSSTAVEMALASYPGANLSSPPGNGAPYGVYVPAFVAADAVQHRVVLPDGDDVVIPHPTTATYDGASHPHTGGEDSQQGPSPSSETTETHTTTDKTATTNTVRRPLGAVAAARSGDKGGDANIGVWVDSDTAWEWLRSTLTTQKLGELLPEATAYDIDRIELPNLRALNFVIKGILGKGVAHGYRFDPQAKGLAEWLRSRYLDIPVELIESDTVA